MGWEESRTGFWKAGPTEEAIWAVLEHGMNDMPWSTLEGLMGLREEWV